MSLTNYREKFSSLHFDMLEPHILRITISNPGKKNATSAEMHRDLSEVWRSIDVDSDVDVVFVEGEGDTFSAGGEFDTMARIRSDLEFRLRVAREAKELVYNIVNCSKPVVSGVRGAAVGAGLVVAVMSDVSVVSKTAKIIDGHTRLGLAAGDHAVMSWPLHIGMPKAKYYLLTCRPMTGEIAEKLGMFSISVDDEEVHDTAVSVARELAAGSATAVRWTKQTLNSWYRVNGPAFDASVAYEFMGFGLPDFDEGLAALREKRQPVFTGPRCE